jgi:tripartite-type tricarboxylate transporter receptor subunit TctC
LTAAALAAPLILPMAARQARAQSTAFPSRPLRIIVPFLAGSGSDSGARAYAEGIGRHLGQPVVVDNRPGASGAVAALAVKAAPADGHTLFIGSNSPMAVNFVLSKSLPYDPLKDFRAVHGMLAGPAAILVRPDSPIRSVADLVAVARREKRPVNIGNYSEGYMLIATWLGLVGGFEVNHVTYKGGAQMQTDLIGGQLEVGTNDLSGVAPLMREGRLRAIAITADKRDPKFPDVPTVKESFSEFETYTWAGFFVRSETPDDITAKLAEAIRVAMNSPEGKAYQAANTTTPLMLGSKEFGDYQRREIDRFRKVAEQAGLQPK